MAVMHFLILMAIFRPAQADETPLKSLGDSPTNFLFVGNPGVGKSTIVNGLIGKVTFDSGLSFGGGLTTSLNMARVPPHTFLDTPGLTDINRRREAAAAITEALRHGGTFKTVFVLKLDSGRLSPDDLVTIKLVLQAAPSIGTNYGILLNQVSDKALKRLENNATERNNLIQGLFQTLPHRTNFITHMRLDRDLEDEDNKFPELPSHFVSWLNQVPSVVIPPQEVKDVKADEFEKFQEQIGKQLKGLEEQNALLNDRLAKKDQEMARANELFLNHLDKVRADAADAQARATKQVDDVMRQSQADKQELNARMGRILDQAKADKAQADAQMQQLTAALKKAQQRESYTVLAAGAPGCPDGMEIKTYAECARALETLSLLVHPAWNGDYEWIPAFCSVRMALGPGDESRMHFNSDAGSWQGRKDLSPVCKVRQTN